MKCSEGNGRRSVLLHEGLRFDRPVARFSRAALRKRPGARHWWRYARYGYGQSDVLAEPRVPVQFHARRSADIAAGSACRLRGIERPGADRALRRRLDRADPCRWSGRTRCRPGRHWRLMYSWRMSASRASPPPGSRSRQLTCLTGLCTPSSRTRGHLPPVERRMARPGLPRLEHRGSTCPAGRCPVLAIQGETTNTAAWRSVETRLRARCRGALRAAETASLRPLAAARSASDAVLSAVTRFVQELA